MMEHIFSLHDFGVNFKKHYNLEGLSAILGYYA